MPYQSQRSEHSSPGPDAELPANRNRCSKHSVSSRAAAQPMSTEQPSSARVTPDKEPMAQNKKIYVLDCGGQYCHLIASRLRRHEALSVIVPRAAASRSKRRVCSMARRSRCTTSTPSTTAPPRLDSPVAHTQVRRARRRTE